MLPQWHPMARLPWGQYAVFEDHVLEVTYDPVVDAEQWRRRELDDEGKRVLLKD